MYGLRAVFIIAVIQGIGFGIVMLASGNGILGVVVLGAVVVSFLAAKEWISKWPGS